MRRASGADLSSTDRLSTRLNLRRSNRVGAWYVMFLTCVVNVLVRGTVTCISCLRNCVDWVSVLRHSQKSGKLGVGGSVGGGYNYYWSGRPQGILRKRLWPSPTDWSP